ncbi:glutamate--cysteine ligase, partial [Providencia rettgeri]|nr:glutamate--cysteine ligase [Providencia rettgeri]
DKIDDDTLTMPWATSLRMSDLGYHNKEAQAELQLCYNDLDTFVMRMYHAAVTPWPDYEKLGTHRDGEWIQLNTHILQIENEYYSSIRPKRTTQRSEHPATALAQRGVEYIEVRCLDIDPESPTGISEQTCRFLDTFLLFCAVQDSPFFPDGGYCQDSKNNFATVVREGRRPGLMLTNQQKQAVSLQQWGREILESLLPYAHMLDHALDTDGHTQAVQAQMRKLDDPERTPSAQLLKRLHETGLSFHDYALQRSREHHASLLAHPLPADKQAAFEQQAADSLQAQLDIEAQDQESFEDYVQRYERNLIPPEIQNR